MTTGSSNQRCPVVLHVVHSVEPGGTERVLCRLARVLSGTDARHVVCSLRNPRPFGGVLGDDLEVISLHADRRDRLLFVKLAGVIRRWKAGVVHARNWGTWTDAALATRLVPGTRLVCGFHGLQNGLSFTAAQRRRARWLGLPSRTATAVSNAARDLLIRDMGWRADRIQVIRNGVDLDRFTPTTPPRRARARAQLGLEQDDLVIGSVANFFENVKGHAVLIDAFARLAQADGHARLLLVGYGPLEPSLRAHATRRGVRDQVIFTGRREDVPEILPALDVFVCSSHSEGMSNAVLEAMATALPCVVTDVSDHRRMFAQVDPDLVVPPGDAGALAGRLSVLAADAQARGRLGQSSRAVVEQGYSFDRTVAGYRRLYREMSSERRAPARTGPRCVTPASCPAE